MSRIWDFARRLLAHDSAANNRASDRHDGETRTLYKKLQSAEDPDTRSRLVSEISSRGFGLLRIVEQMPYAIELAWGGIRAQLDGPQLNHLCGIIGLTHGDELGALKFVEEAMHAAPRDEKIRNSLGVIQLSRGNVAGAIVALTSALEIAPNFIAAQMNMDIARGAFHRPLLRK